MNCKDKIEEYIKSMSKEEIIFASDLYAKEFREYVTEAAFFKMMERLVTAQKLQRVSKGIYAKVISTKEDINNAVLNFYFGNNNDSGLYIGYKLYNKYGISDYKDNIIELYSTIPMQDRKQILNVIVKRIQVDLSYDNARIIEALEILQNFKEIKSINSDKFKVYMRQITQFYNDMVTIQILSTVKYKKSTIAFLKEILDKYNVDNSLAQLLSCASRYKIPKVL